MENNENIKENATVDTNSPTSAGRNTDIDVSSLLKASKEPIQSNKSDKTPLQAAKEAKENGGMGLVVDTNELINGSKETPLITNKTEYDAMGEIDTYMAEQDKMISVAKSTTFDRPPANIQETISMMGALEDMANSGNVSANVVKVNPTDESTNETVNNDNQKNNEENIPDEKRQIINILIDKTGFGGEFKFTPDEQEKISTSTEIRLKEVEEVDLSTITVKRTDKSFVESASEYQISSSMTPVVFPASRFRASMTGLTFGEMGDISLNSENVTFEQIRKKLTVIYNKMVNPSIGKFESFDDFLKKFAYVDLDLAIYGMIVATFPEVDEINLDCNNPKCNKSFTHKYSPRTLLRFDKAGDKFLSSMKDVINCDADKFDELVKQSPTRTYKRIKLPYSNFIIEIGIASSYDYLYNLLDNMIGDKFSKSHPDDVNGILQLNTSLLALVRAVYVPQASGEYVIFDEFEDVINALYMIKPEEIGILGSILQKYTDAYDVKFELTDIKCPHCGTVTKEMPLDVNYLVFLKYQRLMSTSIDIDNIGVL